MTDATMLQIIFFAMFLGVTLTLLPEERSQPILGFFNGLNDAMIKMVMIIMKVAPIGVFALIAVIIGEFGYEILLLLSLFTAITIAGFFIHMLIIYTLALKFLTKMKVSTFFKGWCFEHPLLSQIPGDAVPFDKEFPRFERKVAARLKNVCQRQADYTGDNRRYKKK